MTFDQIQELCIRLNASPWQQRVLHEELVDYPWHTGTPTESGWYLIKYICVHEGKYKGNIWYSTLRIEIHEDGYIDTSGGIGTDDVWKPVEYLRIGDVWKLKEID